MEIIEWTRGTASGWPAPHHHMQGVNTNMMRSKGMSVEDENVCHEPRQVERVICCMQILVKGYSIVLWIAKNVALLTETLV